MPAGIHLVERIRSRGAVHRKFAGFLAEGAQAIAAGLKVVAGEKEVGEITSAASLPVAGGEYPVALGYLRREAALPGKQLQIGHATAIVANLPFAEVFKH